MKLPLNKQREIALELARDSQPSVNFAVTAYNQDTSELIDKKDDLILESYRLFSLMISVVGNIVGILKKGGTLSESYNGINSKVLLNFIDREPLMRYYCTYPSKLRNDISSDRVSNIILDAPLMSEIINFDSNKYEQADISLSTMCMDLAIDKCNALSILSFSFIAMRAFCSGEGTFTGERSVDLVLSHVYAISKNVFPTKVIDASVLLIYEQILLFDILKTSLALIVTILTEIYSKYEHKLPKDHRTIKEDYLYAIGKIACTDSLINVMYQILPVQFPKMLDKYRSMWELVEKPKLDYTTDLEILERLAKGELLTENNNVIRELAGRDLTSLSAAEKTLLFSVIDQIKGGGYVKQSRN